MRRCITTIFMALLTFTIAVPSTGQVATATFYGIVADASDALIPGATATLTHEGTGARFETLTDERGEFAFTFLRTGSYTLRIELPGFRTHVSTAFELGSGQNVRRRFVLEVAAAAASEITVTGEAPLVNSVSPEIRESYSTLQITELPLPNRELASILDASPGVTRGGTNIRINGMGGAGTTLSVDGSSATVFSEGNATNIFGNFTKIGLVGLDAVAEVETSKGVVAAEYAGTLAGNINVITRSGTNEWHGSLFHNYTGAALNARQQTVSTKPQFVFNQFGGTLGGPIIRNKMFIFGTYEGYRQAGKDVQQGTVPTQRLRNAMIAAVPAYKQYVDAIFPLPNQPHDPSDDAARVIGTSPLTLTENHITLKMDTNLSSSSSLALGYSRSRPNQLAYELLLNPIKRDGKVDRANASYVLARPGWTSETRIGYNYASWLRIDDLIYLRDPIHPDEKVLGGRRIPTIEGLGFFSPNGELQFMGGATWTIEQKVSKIIGEHALKFGGLYATRGTGRETYVNPEIHYANEADLLANIPSEIQVGFGMNPFNLYMPEWGLFIQDDWRVSSRLTLNLGIRYDSYGNPVLSAKEPDRPAVINTFEGIVDTKRFVYGPLRAENDPAEPDHVNFGPRLGFAFDPDGQTKNVIRGGFALMFAPRNNSIYASAVGQSLTIPYEVTFSRAEAAARGFKYPTYSDHLYDAVAAQKDPIPYVHTIFAPDQHAPYMMNWSLGIQRAFGATLMLETAYVANRGVKFPLLRWFNEVDRLTGLRPNQDLPYQGYYYDPSQTTIYHSWQSSLRKRYSNNIIFNLHHTWAKGLSYVGGNAAGWFSGDNNRAAIQDFNDWKANRSPVSGDLTHVVTGDFIYELPTLANWNRGLQQILGSWQMSGMIRAETGGVANVSQRSPGGPPSRPDIIDFGNMYLDNWEQTGQYLNPAAFALVPINSVSRLPTRPGTAGLNAIRGPGQWNLDFAFAKNFPLREDIQLQFRVDMFNALNHTNPGNPITSIEHRDFGKITTTRGARTIQLHGRISF